MVAGCSLLTVKTPDKPLSTRDLNVRVLTRELSTQFVSAVEQCADDVVQTEKDPVVLQNSLRWEIAAVADSRRAATQTAPFDSTSAMGQIRSSNAPGGAYVRERRPASRNAPLMSRNPPKLR